MSFGFYSIFIELKKDFFSLLYWLTIVSLTGCWREFSYKSPSRFLVSSTIETYDLRKAKLWAKFKAGMPFKFPKLHRVRLCNFPRNVSNNSIVSIINLCLLWLARKDNLMLLSLISTLLVSIWMFRMFMEWLLLICTIIRYSRLEYVPRKARATTGQIFEIFLWGTLTAKKGRSVQIVLMHCNSAHVLRNFSSGKKHMKNYGL